MRNTIQWPMHGKMLLIWTLVDQGHLQLSLTTSLSTCLGAEIVFKLLKILLQAFKKLRFTQEKSIYGKYCSWKTRFQFLTWVFLAKFLRLKFLFLEVNIKQRKSSKESTTLQRIVSFSTLKNLQFKKDLLYKIPQALRVKWFPMEITYMPSVVMTMSIDFLFWTSPGHLETDYPKIGSNPIQSGRKALLINLKL